MKASLRSIITLCLCTCMLFFAAGCSSGTKTDATETTKSGTEAQSGTTETENGVPAYLNAGGTLPIVKEGNDKGFTMAALLDVNAKAPESLWAYQFMKNAMNINVKIEGFTAQNQKEYIPLLFASNDLPDVILGGALTADDLVRYGSQEGQIMDLAPYLNQTCMPNLTALYEKNPDWKNAVIDGEGHVYSLGYINDPADQGQIPRLFYNYDWLDKLNLKVPTTLDEFVNMLRAFKTLGDNIIPIGGGYENTATNSTLGILNAFGYNTFDPKAITIGLRNGKAVLPAADREAYGAYLTLMNTLYTEKLISPDFYTMDATTMKANMAEGRNGVIAQAPFLYTDKFNEWWGAVPLTSEYNKTAFWPESNKAITAGSFVVSSKCEVPELVAVFADWFFDADSINYSLFTNGACSKDTEHLYGTQGWTVTDDESRTVVYNDYENNKTVYNSKNEFLAQRIQLMPYKTLGYGYWSTIGTYTYQLMSGYSRDKIIDGYPDIKGYKGDVPIRKTITYNETHFRSALKDTLVDLVVEGYPNNVYFDAETSVKVGNLKTIINEYAEQESAKFITGARPLSELNAYFDEIERLGAKEYVKYYEDYYNAIKGK